MTQNQNQKNGRDRHQPPSETDARDPKQRDDGEEDPAEGRDRPPFNRDRDPNSPWLGGG